MTPVPIQPMRVFSGEIWRGIDRSVVRAKIFGWCANYSSPKRQRGASPLCGLGISIVTDDRRAGTARKVVRRYGLSCLLVHQAQTPRRPNEAQRIHAGIAAEGVAMPILRFEKEAGVDRRTVDISRHFDADVDF